MSILPDKEKTKVTSKEIGNYEVSMDSGNEYFIHLIYSLWTPDNPMDLDRHRLCLAMCSYICYNIYTRDDDMDFTKTSMAQTLCEALIYGWAKPETPRYIDKFTAQKYIGIKLGETYFNGVYAGILEPNISFLEMEKKFNPTVWEELKPFLFWLGEVIDIEYIG